MLWLRSDRPSYSNKRRRPVMTSKHRLQPKLFPSNQLRLNQFRSTQLQSNPLYLRSLLPKLRRFKLRRLNHSRIKFKSSVLVPLQTVSSRTRASQPS